SFRIKAVDPRTLISPPKKRGRKSKSDYSKSDYSKSDYSKSDYRSSSSYSFESKRMTRGQRIYQETTRGVNVKQLNGLISKNRETKFFSWIPKTFAEIEEMILDEIGYSSISKEIERTLVFLLTYSPQNTRTYTLGKKMFDAYENLRFFYTPIPVEISEMTPVLKEACVDFLNRLFLDDSFSSFIKPVNTETHRTYLDVVRFPMCLEIVQKKMNVYRSLEAFFGDLRQIHKNCCYFNQNSSEICNNARKLMRYLAEFHRHIMAIKIVHRSQEVIKALLSRFSNSSIHQEILYKVENRIYKTFYELFSDVDKIKESYMRVVISPQQLKNDIEDFKAQIYYWFNVIEGKTICFGL
ncbi:Transcription intermediary factor 1-alpha, partial [Nosema granulosis]